MKIVFDHIYGHVVDNKVFCEAFAIPENETYDDLLELGWLPSQPPLYWYQSRSLRVDYNKIKLSYKRKKIVSSLRYEIHDYTNIKTEVDNFFKVYFLEKNLDFENYYNLNSNFFKLNVMKVFLGEEVIGYTRFQNLYRNLLGMETAYTSDHSRLSLGINSIILLSQYVKDSNKSHLYIFESYPEYFPYKSQIPGIEHWEGEKWI